jgi:hydrogenase expression/formation protein HypD
VIRFVDEFRDRKAAEALVASIRAVMPDRPVVYMEICGGHTMTAVRYGLRGLLPTGLKLKSGPGCPVCVTPQEYIDTAIMLARERDVIIASFGDMLKVPGSTGTLLEARSAGRDVRICLSPLEAVEMAERLPDKQVVFLGIGFETTAPTVAMAVLTAGERHIENFSVLTALKTMPQAMAALLEGPVPGIDGFICPGHVTAVAGARMYQPVAEGYGVPCVISGFEPTDMLSSILMLLRQTNEGRAATEIQYTRAVTLEGNPAARKAMAEVFKPADAVWRGLGMIPGSGLVFKAEYSRFDASHRYALSVPPPREHPGCRCGDVMRGLIEPVACPLFGRACTPARPLGACMVSAEGACGIHFHYGTPAAGN